jgi:subtilisin family serine protease
MDWHVCTRMQEAHEALEKRLGYSTGQPIIGAIVDDGCDVNHPHLRNALLEPITLDGNIVNDSSHGTLSAGLIVGEPSPHDQFPGGGVAPFARTRRFGLIPVRYYSDYDINKDMAMYTRLTKEKGARVISNSFGWANALGKSAGVTLGKKISTLTAEYQCTFVFAAGNESSELTQSDLAHFKDAILVAASTCPQVHDLSQEVKVNSSNYGAGITVCAPGGEAGAGIRPVSTVNGGGFGLHAQTSAACPMVAGVIALMLIANPALTAQDVKELLCQTADQIHPTCQGEGRWREPGQVLSAGQRGALPASLLERPYSKYYGFGRVNAMRAVWAAMGRTG